MKWQIETRFTPSGCIVFVERGILNVDRYPLNMRTFK